MDTVIKVAVFCLALLLAFLSGAYVGKEENYHPIWTDYLSDLRDKLTPRCEDLEEHGKLSEMNALMYAVDLIEEELSNE